MVTNPYKDLAESVTGHIKKHVDKNLKGIPAELGTITAAGGVQLDTFKHEISSYLVADWQAKLDIPAFAMGGSQSGLLDSKGGQVTGAAAWAFGPATIDQVHVEIKPDLKAGDRVLCIPVNNGLSVVVLCKVVANDG
jgi:hypothetical protein